LTWSKVTTLEQCEEFNSVLCCEPSYQGNTSPEVVAEMLDNNYSLWLYVNGSQKAAIAIRTETGFAFIVCCMPEGFATGHDAGMILVPKVRDIVDELGIENYQGVMQKTYASSLANEWREFVASQLWELIVIEDAADRWRYKFSRDSSRLSEDSTLGLL